MKFLFPALLICILLSCKTQVYVADTDVTYNQIEYKDAKEDDQVAAMIAPYKDKMSAEMDEVVGYLPETLTKGRPNSNLGNWFCDALLSETTRVNPLGADFAIQNYGGLRIPSIAKGDLTRGKIFELMPFDNLFVILELDGPTTQQLLDKMASSGGYPISKGLTFTINDGKATNIKIGGEAFDNQKTYRVAMPDYIANGGDSCDFLKGIPQDNSGLFIREVILDHLNKLKMNGEKIQIDDSKRIFND